LPYFYLDQFVIIQYCSRMSPPRRQNEPHVTRLTGFFGVTDSPASSKFPSFKRQFHASVAVGPGFIDIQSKTKAREFARIKVSSLNEKPFIRPNLNSVVVLRNSGREENWFEIGIKALSSNMANDLCGVLTEKGWPPESNTAAAAAAAPPADPISAAADTTNMDIQADDKLAFAFASASSDDIQMVNNNNNNLKIRVRVNKDQPSNTAVITPPSIANHRPKIMVKTETNFMTTNYPLAPPLSHYQSPPPTEINANNLFSRAQSAPRALQFGGMNSQRDTQSQPRNGPASSPFHGQQLLIGENSQQMQSAQIIVGQSNGTSNQMENMDLSFNQTPARSPMGMAQLQHLLTPSPTPPLLQTSLGSGLLGGLGNTSTGGGYWGMNLGGFSGGGSLVGSSQIPRMDDEELREYRRFAAEFEKLAAIVARLPSEKRRHMIKIAQSVTDMMCSQEM
ncbi:hypothetical protein PENTCL1PPCAC_12002, partial [Pristionchus entomophagus]